MLDNNKIEMAENTVDDLKKETESMALVVFKEQARQNKRTVLSMLAIIIILIGVIIYQNYNFHKIINGMKIVEETITYTADSTGDGNSIINDNGGSIILNGESNKNNNQKDNNIQ